MEQKCDLCDKANILSGKDLLLHEDSFCYIVDNGDTDGYARRISLTLNQHGGMVTPSIERLAVYRLREYVTTTLHIPSADFFIKKTMRTYPDHFHIHAYILPKQMKGG